MEYMEYIVQVVKNVGNGRIYFMVSARVLRAFLLNRLVKNTNRRKRKLDFV